MTCKDCLHYEICEAYSPRDSYATLHCAEECVCFTDRSEWVWLPCKVGDKLYKVVPDFEKPRGSLKIQEYTISVIIADVLITNPYNAFKVNRIGADVFLTREEAEKALEGMK